MSSMTLERQDSSCSSDGCFHGLESSWLHVKPPCLVACACLRGIAGSWTIGTVVTGCAGGGGEGATPVGATHLMQATAGRSSRLAHIQPRRLFAAPTRGALDAFFDTQSDALRKRQKGEGAPTESGASLTSWLSTPIFVDLPRTPPKAALLRML
ncbi:hypothetical protein FOA52_008415 [Chlamydomonas sp. UWO 241]|nr:hypothetical protein FOA52_008415 [Chlamydomonas sp. UWO 241]